MGIKNFSGPRKKQEPEQTPLSVRDYMTRDLITFRPDQSVEEVIDLLIKHRISGGPVVDDDGKLVGVISEGDCIKHVSESRYFNMPVGENTVSNRMIRDVETIDGDMNIFDAANKFLTARRRRFPILENGRLVGQISQKDILKATVQLKSQNWR
ncbi:CBS domain-containing protein [Muriicola marianensis]|uniref:Membrane protein n=1 Tax=Muriicola marianensis TaxID=1324801 RepID=A0ABQ1QZ76_9FLAO|nr:CBS domain-containing protein [Muriicola marianensis]GGD50689.1 membrane protein [Muriicola marianensis]